MIFKCEIYQTLTKYNKESKDWSGEIMDYGVIETLKAKNEIDLLKKVDELYTLSSLEVYEDEGEDFRLETNFTNDENNLIDLQFRFYRVHEVELNLTHEINIINRFTKIGK